MKYISIILLVFATDTVNAQTVIIARKTKDAVYVGADSKQVVTKVVSYSDADTSWEMTADSAVLACKIISEGKFNIAFEGWGTYESEPLTRAACQASDSFRQLMNKHADDYLPVLRDQMKMYREKFPEKFEDMTRNFHNNLATVFFFGFEGGKPFLGINDYRMKRDSRGNLEFTAAMHELGEFAAGHTKEIIDTLYKSKTVWDRGTVRTIKYLIQLVCSKYGFAVPVIACSFSCTHRQCPYIL